MNQTNKNNKFFNRVMTMFLFFSVILEFNPGNLARASGGDLRQSRRRYNQQIALIDKIRIHVERRDLGWLMTLRKLASDALGFMSDGTVNIGNINGVVATVIAFSHSGKFLNQIITPRSREDVEKLIGLTQTNRQSLGLDQNPYGQLAFNIFGQMIHLTEELNRLSLPGELESEIRELKREVRRKLPIVSAGDRRDSLEIASTVYCQIQSLYPVLDGRHLSYEAGGLAQELIGLNRFLGSLVALKRGEECQE